MIDLYYWTTPNGHKITMFMEEAGLAYHIHPVNLTRNEQFEPAFLAISPNNKMPAIVDRAPDDGGEAVAMFESGAILLYLADKTGKLIGNDAKNRLEVIEWLFWQMAGVGPMLGQNGHFSRFAPEKIPYAIDRYVKETARLYGVLDKRLADREFIAGSYSIADIACYPWMIAYEMLQQNIEDFPHVKRWLKAIHSRPATIRAYQKGIEINPSIPLPKSPD